MAAMLRASINPEILSCPKVATEREPAVPAMPEAVVVIEPMLTGLEAVSRETIKTSPASVTPDALMLPMLIEVDPLFPADVMLILPAVPTDAEELRFKEAPGLVRIARLEWRVIAPAEAPEVLMPWTPDAEPAERLPVDDTNTEPPEALERPRASIAAIEAAPLEEVIKTEPAV